MFCLCYDLLHLSLVLTSCTRIPNKILSHWVAEIPHTELPQHLSGFFHLSMTWSLMQVFSFMDSLWYSQCQMEVFMDSLLCSVPNGSIYGFTMMFTLPNGSIYGITMMFTVPNGTFYGFTVMFTLPSNKWNSCKQTLKAYITNYYYHQIILLPYITSSSFIFIRTP